VKPIGVWAPNHNSVAERFVQSAQQEYLNRSAVFVETLWRHILSEHRSLTTSTAPLKAWGTGCWSGRSWSGRNWTDL
jgi:hypothetical protein